MSEKEQAIKALEELPDDATVEDAIERLFLIFKIEEGLRESRKGQGIPHEEIKKRYLG